MYRNRARLRTFIALYGLMADHALILMLSSKLIHGILRDLFQTLLVEFEFDFTHIRTFLPERLPLAEQFYSCPASPQHSEPNGRREQGTFNLGADI